MTLVVSTTLRRDGFVSLGILPEDGRPRGSGKDGWSDRERTKDREGDWGLDLGPGGPHRKYRSSSAFSRFPKAPPASRMEPAPVSMLSDCRESRGHEKKKGTTKERGPALHNGRWVVPSLTESEPKPRVCRTLIPQTPSRARAANAEPAILFGAVQVASREVAASLLAR